jgi:tight adherence protein C
MPSKELIIPILLASVGAILIYFDQEEDPSGNFMMQSQKRLGGLPDRTKVRERLSQLGRENEYESFRMRQIGQALLLSAITFALAFIVNGSFFLALLISVVAGIGAYFYIDRQLSREVGKYRSAIESEFPAIIEMLTLGLSAGLTPLGAITRIAARSHGLLADEFGIVIASVRAGEPFHVALDGLGRRVQSVVIRRFVDALITAMLRGAPLIDVLQRHAAEARDIQRNHLMDKAGKAEISMMVPVVFLILPVSILFALWPSVIHLNLFAA